MKLGKEHKNSVAVTRQTPRGNEFTRASLEVEKDDSDTDKVCQHVVDVTLCIIRPISRNTLPRCIQSPLTDLALSGCTTP